MTSKAALFAAGGLFLLAGTAGVRAERYLEEYQTPLVKAVREGTVEDVRELLASGPIGEPDRCHARMSLASYASERGELETLEELVRAGASVDGEDCEGDFPLYHSAAQGHADVVRFLLSKEARADLRAGNGSTPLLAAVEGSLFEKGPEGDVLETARLLLEAGSDPDAENGFGATPLLLAVRRADARLVRLLLEHKADPLRKGKDGRTPLETARKDGLGAIVALLEGKAPPPPSADELKLIEASIAGDTATIKGLLAAGVSAGATDGDASTALIHAAANGREEAGLELISGGAPVDSRNASNGTALIFAAHTASLRLLKALLEAGADPSAKDRYGNTALSYAARAGVAESVRLLLARGVPPDETDEEGETLLMEAAAEGDADVVRALVQGKAAVDAADKSGRTALMLAAKEGRTEAAIALLEAGASLKAADKDGMTPLRWALDGGALETARALLERGAAAEPAALCGAVRAGDPGIVALLLEKGAGLKSPEAGQALLLAARSHRDKVPLVKLLAEAGADLDAADEEGRTALMEAAQWSSTDSLRAVEYLLSRGADPRARDAKGRTAWTHAMLTGHNSAAALIEKAGAPAECETLEWEASFLEGSLRSAEVLSDQPSFEAAWRKARKDSEAPLLDFKACVAAFVSLGTILGPDTATVEFEPPVVEGDTLLLDYSLGRGIIYDAASTSPWILKVFKLSGAKKASLKQPPDVRPRGFELIDLQPPPGGGYRE